MGTTADVPERELIVPDGNILEINGRRFKPLTKTKYKQDIYVMSLLRDAGLVQMAAGFNPLTDDVSEVAQEIIVKAFAAGQLFQILGATMAEEGVPWTIEGSKANAEFFENLEEEDDKKQLHGAIVGVLMGFFVSGALASAISQKSSDPSGARPPMDPAALRDGTLSTAAPSEAPSTTGTGTT